jgi:BlaI family transcriptional regulator, penicillinase repressor
MGAANQMNVSDAELEVLKLLWLRGPSTVRDVAQHLKQRDKQWAYTTILTLLSRLRDKGFVRQEKHGTGAAHVFTAGVTREQLLGQRLTELAEQVCDGTAGPLVHALVKSRRLKREDIAHLRRLLTRLEETEE